MSYLRFTCTLFALLVASQTPLAKAGAEDSAPAKPETLLFLQEENTFVHKLVDPSLTVMFLRPLSQHFGIFADTYVSKPYAETYAGPAYILNEHFSVGIGAGLEQARLVDEKAKTSARGGLIASLNYDSFNAFGMFEVGGSGIWYRLYGTFRPAPWIGAGVIGDALLGVGIYFDVVIPKTPIQLYGGAPVKDDRANGILGIRLWL